MGITGAAGAIAAEHLPGQPRERITIEAGAGSGLDLRVIAPTAGASTTATLVAAQGAPMRPGETRWSDVTLANDGETPVLVSVEVTTREEGSGRPCFLHRFAPAPAQGAARGAAVAAGRVPFGGTTRHAAFAASRAHEWQPGAAATYRLEITMDRRCTKGSGGTAAAAGTAQLTVHARQSDD